MKNKVENYLAQLKNHHRETYEHCLRVAFNCRSLSVTNSLPPQDIDLVYNSGLLHDIGKTRVPINILSKTGELTEEEREEIERHVRYGFIFLEGDDFREVREVIVRHHEFSINPYPRSGEDRRRLERTEDRREEDQRFSTLGQILAVSDIRDALSMARSYKPALGKEEVERQLRSKFTGDLKYIEQVMKI